MSSKILVIGDAIFDKFSYYKNERQAPDNRDVPVLDLVYSEVKPGGCLNVASNINTLSPEMYVLTCSIYSNTLLASSYFFLPICGVEGQTIEKERVTFIDGKTIARLDNREKFLQKDVYSFRKFLTELYPLPSHVDAVVFSDYNKGIVDEKLVAFLHSKYPTAYFFIDTKQRDLSIYSCLMNKEKCYLKLNAKEYAESNARQLGWNSNMIITDGNNGSLVVNSPHAHTVPVKNVSQADTNGAGDVHLAGLVVSILEGKKLLQAVEFANRCAAQSVKKKGTVTVNRAEVE